MAHDMKEIFGDTLAKGNSDTDPLQMKVLPSPEDLRGKILVKGKMLRTFGVEEDFDEEDGKEMVL